MKAVNTHEAKTHLSRLLRRVAAGEEITIANRGVPVARLVPVPPKKAPRVLGIFRGEFSVPDDFDAPLRDDILDLGEPFEGFRRVIRGADREQRGLVERDFAVSLDGGAGRSGSLLAACFGVSGAVLDTVEA